MSQKRLATVAAAGSLKRPHVMPQSAVGAQALGCLRLPLFSQKLLCAAPLMSQWTCLYLSLLCLLQVSPQPLQTQCLLLLQAGVSQANNGMTLQLNATTWLELQP